jgi:hypothetical protein
MKILTMTFLMLFAPVIFSHPDIFTFEDRFKLQKIVLDQELLFDLYELRHDAHFGISERMIAGKFDVSEKRPQSRSYFDGLRSRLKGSKFLSRF